MEKTVAIITGADGGIGKEFVRELNKEALDLDAGHKEVFVK